MTVTKLPSTRQESVGSDPMALYDRYAALYAAFRLHVFPDDRRDIADALALPTAHRIAEIGCGPGFYARSYAKAYPQLHVTGIDRAPAQLAIARRRTIGLANVAFVQGDARMLGRWHSMFDGIIASRLFMVVSDRVRVLAEMRAALSPGGRLVLAEPLALPRVSVLDLMHGLAPRSEQFAQPAPPVPLKTREYIFTQTGFAALARSQPWTQLAFWQAHGHRYACCVK